MAAEPGIRLTLYSRAYCHLCDDMLAELAALQAQCGFAVQTVDVDGDDVLESRYGERVPVLAHGERELCHYHLDAAGLTAYLTEIG
jgi:Glutaredoxin-like domain (DUF836)